MTMIRKHDIKDIINPLSSNILNEVIIYQKPTSSSVNDEIINQGLVQYFYTDKEDKSTKEICKTYAVGYNSKYSKLIKMFLNKWIPNEKDKLNENSDIFDAKTSKILLLFNNRFDIKAEKNEITMEHMKIFKDIFNNALSVTRYPFEGNSSKKDKLQKKVVELRKTVYELFTKQGADEAIAKLSDKPKINRAKQSLSSRSGYIYGINKLRDLNDNLVYIFETLSDFLNQEGYRLNINRGIGRSINSGSLHPHKRAIDFSVFKSNGQGINLRESRILAIKIREFLAKTLIPSFGRIGFINEYDPEEIRRLGIKSDGGHMHISLPYPNTRGL